METNLKNNVSNRLLHERHLSKKMKIKEAEIYLILKILLHEPHSSRSETIFPQTIKYVGCGESTSTELSDEEMLEEMGSGLIQDDHLTKEELKRVTSEGSIPTMISGSGASTTCIHPEEKQGQKSECGWYKRDAPFIKTEQESDRIFQMARGDMAPGEDSVYLHTLSL